MNSKRFISVIFLTIILLMVSLLIPAGQFFLDSSFNVTVYAEEQGINQNTSTTGGTVKRHIDVSSPFSGGYLFEDMKVVGRASITESFTMDNISPGSSTGTGIDDWDIGPSGGNSDGAVETGRGSVSSEANSAAGPGSNTSSSSAESSTAAVEEKAETPKEAVLGTSIVSYPSWLDLF